MISALFGRTGTAVSDLSHDDIGWRVVRPRETIPSEMAYLTAQSEVIVTEEMRNHPERIAQRLGISSNTYGVGCAGTR
jgi:hypothetical protein